MPKLALRAQTVGIADLPPRPKCTAKNPKDDHYNAITAYYLRIGGEDVSPWRCLGHRVLLFVFLALRGRRFYRIFFVGGRLTYLSTPAHPPPSTSRKLSGRWIWARQDVLTKSGSINRSKTFGFAQQPVNHAKSFCQSRKTEHFPALCRILRVCGV